jgi:hypothetical protein
MLLNYNSFVKEFPSNGGRRIVPAPTPSGAVGPLKKPNQGLHIIWELALKIQVPPVHRMPEAKLCRMQCLPLEFVYGVAQIIR